MRPLLAIIAFAVLLAAAPPLSAAPGGWTYEWPKTDFKTASVDLKEIRSGGPPRDGIPPIDKPVFEPAATYQDLEPTEPVIGLTIGDNMRAYPLRILMWHEIVNDTVGGVPVSVTFCPLCNAAIVFDRRDQGRGRPCGARFRYDRQAAGSRTL